MPDYAEAGAAARRPSLARRRRKLGLTQEDLAGMLGIERSTVVRWEGGTSEPRTGMRRKLARALRVPVDQVEELLASGDDGAARPATPQVPRQLPAVVTDFTGRAAELATLTRLLDGSLETPGTVAITAICGTAGVGKTALALRWAHQVSDRFPDGQLYANLRGLDPSGAPATPAEVVRGFLDALGIPPERIPATSEAQAGLFRSLLADRQMLLVLDNARDEPQVRPLLPASPRCLVLVTSRAQLSGLAAADGARLLTLDILTHHEAVQLLTARLGASRVAAEPAAVAEIAGLCGCLPLALVVAAARATARPGLPLAALADELRDAAGRLDALDAGDPAASVRAVFSWSYRQLSEESARIFRLLGLHPGPDISVPAAASLTGVKEADARRVLGELVRAHLITEHAPGRYALHDLLRAYAVAQARGADGEDGCADAVGRVLDHYLHTAGPAAIQINPAHELIALAPPRPGVCPERFADYRQALAWFETEHHVLMAAVALAAGSGFDGYAWQLPWAMALFLRLRGHYQEGVDTQRTALAAATRLGDAAGQAVISRLLGNACRNIRDYGQARGHYSTSLELYKRLGSRLGEAKIQQNLALLAARQHGYADALGHAEQSLQLFRSIGHKAGEVQVLATIGWCNGILGDYQEAQASCRQALSLMTETGQRTCESLAWSVLGYAEHHLGNFAGAASCHQHALQIARELGDRWGEARALWYFGDARHTAGDLPEAREAWQLALAILDDMRNPAADEVREKLAGTSGQSRFS